MGRKLIVGIMSLAVSFVCHPSLSLAAPAYLGAKGCKECHKNEFNEWSTSKHSNAFKRLLPPEDKKEEKKLKRLFSKLNEKLKDDEKLEAGKDYSKSKDCLPCHTTGFGSEGGFKDVASTPDMTGVGCEMCHGPGSDYAKLHKEKELTFTRAEAKAAGAVYGSEDAKVCKKCHENPDAKTPIRADVDEKYKFAYEEFIALDKTYHKRYPLKGKH